MSLSVYTSTTRNGSMKSPDRNFQTVLEARAHFLQTNGISIADTTLVQVTYSSDNYRRYYSIGGNTKGDGMTRASTIESDALIVTKPGHALFLPLADCIGAVIHDPAKNILMISHLGRHNLEQYGGTKCVDYLVKYHATNPTNLKIWLSPAAGKDAYPLFAFDNRSLHDVAIEQLEKAGVPHDNIDVSPIDSAVDLNYFSHSQFLKGNRDDDGRFAIVAIMR